MSTTMKEQLRINASQVDANDYYHVHSTVKLNGKRKVYRQRRVITHATRTQWQYNRSARY
jgi:hypothetical protein